jgi:integrase
MARTVQDSKLSSRAARSELDPRSKPYWREISQGEHIGYRKLDGSRAGPWIHRWRPPGGNYTEERIGTADDIVDANNDTVLSFTQAQKLINKRINERGEQVVALKFNPHTYTVKRAWDDHALALKAQGKQFRDYSQTWPALNDIPVIQLTAEHIRDWMIEESETPKRFRPVKGRSQGRKQWSDDPEAMRKRRASTNRYFEMLRACLNRAHNEKGVSNIGWRHVKAFEKTDAARPDFFSEGEVLRLLNASSPWFRDLATAAVLTGARYGSLIRLKERDFNERARTVEFRITKNDTYVARLEDEGTHFFKSLCARRRGREFLLMHPKDTRSPSAAELPWHRSAAQHWMQKACKAAGLRYLNFHQLRHTFASLAIMNGMSLDLVAKALGHKNTRMVEKHYGHVRDDYIAKETRRTLPIFGIQIDQKVVSMR